jgi:hypothetical protein
LLSFAWDIKRAVRRLFQPNGNSLSKKEGTEVRNPSPLV